MSTRRTPSAPLVWRAVRRARARLVEGGGEGGFALIFSLLLIFIVASLSIAIAGIVYNQVSPTLSQRKQISTVNAAAAGLQVSLDQIRTASTVNGSNQLVGLPAQLRCTGATGATFVDNSGASVTASGATFAGTVNTTSGNSASGGTLRYQTSVAYYATDPSSQNLTWLKANALACPLQAAPGYAYLQTHGLVQGQATTSGDRTQHATYQFNTSNKNVAGGRLTPLGSNPALCLDAGSNPRVGSTMQMQPCLALGTPSQSWSYRHDLSLFYEGNPSLNLCIQASTTVGTNATLQTCTSDGTASTYPYASSTQQQQEWPFDDDGHFAAAAAGGGVGSTCLDPAGQTATSQAAQGAYLVVVICDNITTGYNAWNPDPQVGAGLAGGNTTGIPGAPTNQYVNYAEFGRCLDITGQDVTANHLIDYPCKQAPDKTQLTFNQVWTFQAYGSGGFGTMYVTKSGTQYCLTAPSSGVYIVVSPTGNGGSGCTQSPTPYQLWQPTGNLQGNYPNSYELVNQQLTMCMTASSGPNGDLTPGSSNIIVQTCNGTLAQKWNAPPTPPGTGLSNVGENNGAANTTLGGS